MELTKVEYKVRPITRYVVTRYHEIEHGAGSETKGEYDNPSVAHEVAYALCKAEHEHLGWPVADMRIHYPVETYGPIGSGGLAGEMAVKQSPITPQAAQVL